MTLLKELKNRIYDAKIVAPEIPQCVSNNIKYNLYDWQEDALTNLMSFNLLKEYDNNHDATHLMFNMATGAGKTLVMASSILYYYNKGYRKFIFFVNQNNIIDKTESNFINQLHNKYLFTKTITIEDKTVEIKKVDIFSDSNDNIEIKFTSIQKLYNEVHVEKENQDCLTDLLKRDIVMLADEGHHLNANTQKIGKNDDSKTLLTGKTGKDELEKKGWEHTVVDILLHRSGSTKPNRNVLLEFTATIPKNKNVVDKYADKIIAEFSLKQFLDKKYTKEVNLLSSSLAKKERILLALFLNWYRQAIALKNNVMNFKGVILFRSKNIKDSQKDYQEFLKMTENLTLEDFAFLKEIEDKFLEGKNSYEQGKSRVLDAIKFMKKEGDLKSVITYISGNFTKRQCIITNSKTNTTQKEKTTNEQNKLLNSLEDKTNHISVIFTVNRLTEGWDVLNLFDIVRLYGGVDRDSTLSEVQLIGRGVRYYPFTYGDTNRNKRRFEGNKGGHELGVLEEIYYHSDANNAYISELKEELKKEGYIEDDDGRMTTIKLSNKFRNSTFSKETFIVGNERVSNTSYQKKAIQNLKDTLSFKFDVDKWHIGEQEVTAQDDEERLEIQEKASTQTIKMTVKDIEKHIMSKAINIKAKNDKSLLRFNALRKEFSVVGVDDFVNNIIGDFEIEITANDSYDKINNQYKLNMTLKILEKILSGYDEKTVKIVGNKMKLTQTIKKTFDIEVRKNVNVDENMTKLLSKEGWHPQDICSGTSEEISLVDFISKHADNLKKIWENFYLLRNEGHYKIFHQTTGRGFEPDYLLFLEDKKGNITQILIEPKGGHLLDNDKWKNDWLKEITKENKTYALDDKKCKLLGLPFYNESSNDEFEGEFNRLVLKEKQMQ